jgi:molybdenum cofactor cytidylyltransferase
MNRSNENIAAIILAAGYSSRMGDFKPLLQLGDYKAIEHAVRCFQQAGIGDVQVVTGYRAAEVAAVVKPMGAGVVCNPDFDQGMFTSIQAGVRELAPGTQAFFLLPVDIPLVNHKTIEKIINYSHVYQYGIIYPVFQGKRGHPPLISTGYKDEILQGAAQGGLRGILTLHEHDAFNIEVDDETVLLDMDTPSDYQYLLNYQQQKSIPTLEQALQILNKAAVNERIKEHCCAVAYTALDLTEKLNNAGAGLDENLVMAGALLHDIARHEPNHALVGARLVEAWGYPRVASVVAVHMDIEVCEDEPITEAEVVYYVDKMVKGKDLIPVTDRFLASLYKYKDDVQACLAVLNRVEQAGRIARKIEDILDYTYESLLGLSCSREQTAPCLKDMLYSSIIANKSFASIQF